MASKGYQWNENVIYWEDFNKNVQRYLINITSFGIAVTLRVNHIVYIHIHTYKLRTALQPGKLLNARGVKDAKETEM